MKKPLPGSEELLDRVKKALTPERLPLLIAIDGAGMPAVQLDLYLTSLHPIGWTTTELARVVVDHRLDRGRPVIVDGVFVLDALEHIGHRADFLIFVHGGIEGTRLSPQIAAYRSRWRPHELADHTINGFEEQ
jgi:hypothetical protein